MMMMMMMMMAMKAMLLDGDIVDGINGSLRKEMTLQCHSWFLHETTSRNERRNSILMTCHYHIWVVLLTGHATMLLDDK